jgi:nucleosome assembly protein 1-like 1
MERFPTTNASGQQKIKPSAFLTPLTLKNNYTRQNMANSVTSNSLPNNRPRISSTLYSPPPQPPPLPPSFLVNKPQCSSSKFTPPNAPARPPRQQIDPLAIIKRRFNALKQLQMKTASQEARFYEELHLLECKYNKQSKSLYEMRRKIVNGEREPTDEECILSAEELKSLSMGDRGDNEDKSKADNVRQVHQDLLALSILNNKSGRSSNRLVGSELSSNQITNGIPEFWLTVFKRVGLISKMIEPYDEPVLKSLLDVELDLCDRKPFNFAIKFHFAPNEYFGNAVLSKTYEFKIEIDKNEPYVFEAPETECSRGCIIKWKRGKNVTVLGGDCADKSDSSSSDNKDDYNDENKQSSFFNFFDTMPATESGDDQGLTSEQEAELVIDYEIGYTFKEKVVPRAILYYMDEMCDESEDDDNDVDDDDNDDDAEIEDGL